MGTKHSVLTDEKGLPLAVVISGANMHDIKLLAETLNYIVLFLNKNIGNLVVTKESGDFIRAVL